MLQKKESTSTSHWNVSSLNFHVITISGIDSRHQAPTMLTRFPNPLAFGSGSGLQCVYTVVISLWGTPAAKFVLESLKTLFYWIPLCIRKPQAVFQKFSSTHVSPSDRFISSPGSPLSSSPHLPLLMCVFLRTWPFKFPISFQQHLKRALWLIIGTFLMGSRSISEGF